MAWVNYAGVRTRLQAEAAAEAGMDESFGGARVPQELKPDSVKKLQQATKRHAAAAPTSREIKRAATMTVVLDA